MTTGLFTVVIVAYLVWVAVSSYRKQVAKPEHSGRTLLPNTLASEPPKPIYLGLRNQVLQGSSAKLGLKLPPDLAWAVLMDMGVSSATAAVMASAGGTASI